VVRYRTYLKCSSGGGQFFDLRTLVGKKPAGSGVTNFLDWVRGKPESHTHSSSARCPASPSLLTPPPAIPSPESRTSLPPSVLICRAAFTLCTHTHTCEQRRILAFAQALCLPSPLSTQRAPSRSSSHQPWTGHSEQTLSLI